MSILKILPKLFYQVKCKSVAQSSAKKMAVKTGMIGRRHQRSRKEESEFGLARKEFLTCSDCGIFYYDKSWHKSLLGEKAGHFKENKQYEFTLCPACKMNKDKLFEGELVVKFKTYNLKLKTDVLNTVKNSDKQAQDRDPLDRILWMEEGEDGIHIFTSENQLVVRIGKKLESSFPGSKLEINHSKEDIIRVSLEI